MVFRFLLISFVFVSFSSVAAPDFDPKIGSNFGHIEGEEENKVGVSSFETQTEGGLEKVARKVIDRLKKDATKIINEPDYVECYVLGRKKTSYEGHTMNSFALKGIAGSLIKMKQQLLKIIF